MHGAFVPCRHVQEAKDKAIGDGYGPAPGPAEPPTSSKISHDDRTDDMTRSPNIETSLR